MQIIQNLSSTLNNEDASEASNLWNNFAAKLKGRNNLIKMVDRSTIAEYEADLILSDSEKGKKFRQAENRALNLRLMFPGIEHQVISFRSTANMTISHRGINETSASNFFQITSPKIASFDAATAQKPEHQIEGRVVWFW